MTLMPILAAMPVLSVPIQLLNLTDVSAEITDAIVAELNAIEGVVKVRVIK